MYTEFYADPGVDVRGREETVLRMHDSSMTFISGYLTLGRYSGNVESSDLNSLINDRFPYLRPFLQEQRATRGCNFDPVMDSVDYDALSYHLQVVTAIDWLALFRTCELEEARRGRAIRYFIYFMKNFIFLIFNFSENRIAMRDEDGFSDDSLEDNGNPRPQSCFGQTFEKYVNRILVTTIILDGSDWILYNRQDYDYVTTLEAEFGQKNIMSSVGSVGFIASMESNSDDSSGAGTVFEVATKDDLERLQT